MAAKRIVGTVISTKTPKFVVVEVQRLSKHPRFKKYIRHKRKFYAHCEQPVQDGDQVIIEETRPLSRLKRWRVIKVLNES